MLNLVLVFKCVGASIYTSRRTKSSFVMMQWVLPLAIACVMLGTPAQPTACNYDSQCHTGYYCLLDVLSCRKCLLCEDLSRQPPANAPSCIRSVVECGPCLKGLVNDRLGDVGTCTEPATKDKSLPAYVIVIIVVCLLLFVLVVVILVYILRHKDTFKILASTRTSVQAPVNAAAAGEPSAPAPPPPYYEATHCDPERPSSPPQSYSPYHDEVQDPSAPLVKPAAAAAAERRGAREAAGSQAARVYDAPAWVRNAYLPHDYDPAFSDKPEPAAPFVAHDEDTMESPWTPAPPDRLADRDHDESAASANETPSGGASFSLALRRPSRSEVMSPPPKILRPSEDSNNNNNRSSGESSCSLPASPPPPPPAAAPAPAATSVVINVLNVNSLRQLNDVTLN